MLKVKLNEPVAFIHILIIIVQAALYLIFSIYTAHAKISENGYNKSEIAFEMVSGLTDILICCIIICMLHESNEVALTKIKNQAFGFKRVNQN